MQHDLEAIIFDLGGVIINLDYNRTILELAKAMGASPNTIAMATTQHDIFHEFERGKITNDEFLEFLDGFTPKDISRDTLIHFWNAMLLDIPAERIALLKRLSEKYRLFVLSNTNDIHIRDFNRILEEAHGYTSLQDIGVFEKVYLSYEVGHRKPDTEIFSYVVNDAGLTPGRTLFLDDGLPNLEGAKQVGLLTEHVRPDERTILDIFANE